MEPDAGGVRWTLDRHRMRGDIGKGFQLLMLSEHTHVEPGTHFRSRVASGISKATGNPARGRGLRRASDRRAE
jgi:hypothetical protein